LNAFDEIHPINEYVNERRRKRFGRLEFMNQYFIAKTKFELHLIEIDFKDERYIQRKVYECSNENMSIEKVAVLNLS